MKTINVTLYNYDELNDKAKKRALEDWNKDNDDPFMQSMLNDECGQLLTEHGIKCTSNHPICLYLLSYCQGDGLMFEGTFSFKDQLVTVKQSGHYYHSNSKTVTWHDFGGEDKESMEEDIASQFEEIYQTICKELEKQGYEHIEWITSEQNFIESCEANGYTFEANGVMRNE